ncbi:MAG: sodium:solute symporter [Bacteroidetes bacterium]|nr:MAG: sodium:solute symporter [Bacteroidota bacterium]
MTESASSSMVWATAALLVLYMGVILFFVIRGALRTKNMDDYALGSIAFSPVAIGLALAASMTSAATFIINPGIIAYFGIPGVLSYALVMPVAALASLVILTKRFRKHGSTAKALTMAQWMGSKFKHEGMERFFAFLSMLLITFIVLICVGLTQVISKSLDADPVYVLLGVVVFVFGYMMFGGANSMVYTNTIQALLMLVVAFILLGSGYEHFSNGVHGFIDKLGAIDSKLIQTTDASSPLFRDYFEIVFCQIIIGIAVIFQPHIITKSLLLKDERDVNKYLFTGITVEILFFLVVLVGLYARLEFPDLTIGGAPIKVDEVVSTYVVNEFPVYLGLLVVLGLISAGISTLEGLIQSLSTTITADIILPLSGRKKAENMEEMKKQVVLNRWVIALLAVVAFAFSYQQIVHPNLSVAIFAQNGVYAYFAAASIPVCMGLFFPSVSGKTVFLSAVAAVVVHFGIYYLRLGSYMQMETRNPAIPATFAIISAVVIAVVFHQLTKSKNTSNV